MVEHSEAVTPSVKKYRHDLTWQIIVPIIVVGLIIIAGAVFISLGKTGSISLWSDISLIWILLPALFMAFIAGDSHVRTFEWECACTVLFQTVG